MSSINLRSLIQKLDHNTRKLFEQATGACVSRGHFEITIEHVLSKAVENPNGELMQILRHYDVDIPAFESTLQKVLERVPTKNKGQPVFARLLVELLEEAWMLETVEFGAAELSMSILFLAQILNPDRFVPDEYFDLLKNIPGDDLKRNLFKIVEKTAPEEKPFATTFSDKGGSKDKSALQQFGINFTDQARNGKIDPVFGREKEIRQMIDILTRRRKNNPIVVGEAGVGKTAVVEGLALKIVQKDVPEILHGVEIIGLDLGLLQAGASVKGQFEERLKSFIDAVKSSETPIIVFIDEAHTLIGAGGTAGGSDAANLLKPALARGELRTVAATTWSEYKKYFEKDAALARRFQLVKVEEPDIANAVLIMRGLRENYEKAHKVYIRDDAVVATAELAARYISGRQLPDKSVDLLDTACARVKINISSKPEQLDELEKDREALVRELTALKRDVQNDQMVPQSRLDETQDRINHIDDDIASLTDKWKKEKQAVDEIIELREKIAGATKSTEASSAADVEALRKTLKERETQLQSLQRESALIHYQVTPEIVEHVVSDWTGIPVGNMVRDEANAVLQLNEHLGERIKGQNHALHRIAEHIKGAKAGLTNPKTPIGVFLLVGPSGVGKTETGLAIADQMFGGERFTVSVNMSEFQEKHTVSRLIGSPPGYVGYGEGGVLTEAIRQRPYSVVLLDEVEKADPEVMNLFYQVFDKGVLSDGEGRVIDFKNTIILLTSNLATDEIMQMVDADAPPDDESVIERIRPVLSKHFKPALLARMEIVPYYPIGGEAMRDIVKIKMNILRKRIKQSQKVDLAYGDEVIEQIAQRCREVETGARNIDYIINRNLLPRIANEILGKMAAEETFTRMSIQTDDKLGFQFSFE